MAIHLVSGEGGGRLGFGGIFIQNIIKAIFK